MLIPLLFPSGLGRALLLFHKRHLQANGVLKIGQSKVPEIHRADASEPSRLPLIDQYLTLFNPYNRTTRPSRTSMDQRKRSQAFIAAKDKQTKDM